MTGRGRNSCPPHMRFWQSQLPSWSQHHWLRHSQAHSVSMGWRTLFRKFWAPGHVFDGLHWTASDFELQDFGFFCQLSFYPWSNTWPYTTTTRCRKSLSHSHSSSRSLQVRSDYRSILGRLHGQVAFAHVDYLNLEQWSVLTIQHSFPSCYEFILIEFIKHVHDINKSDDLNQSR